LNRYCTTQLRASSISMRAMSLSAANDSDRYAGLSSIATGRIAKVRTTPWAKRVQLVSGAIAANFARRITLKINAHGAFRACDQIAIRADVAAQRHLQPEIERKFCTDANFQRPSARWVNEEALRPCLSQP
jgi:hypothetical protein